jgi:hypothetical protein
MLKKNIQDEKFFVALGHARNGIRAWSLADWIPAPASPVTAG